MRNERWELNKRKVIRRDHERFKWEGPGGVSRENGKYLLPASVYLYSPVHGRSLKRELKGFNELNVQLNFAWIGGVSTENRKPSVSAGSALMLLVTWRSLNRELKVIL